MKLAVYPGTFDPITKGHVDVASRALHIFDRLVIAVACNPWKKPFFSFEERIEMTRDAIAGIKEHDCIEVTGYKGLTVDFARQTGAISIIRGLRAVSDFEYELQIALTNRKLSREIESVFLMPSVEYIYLNSTMVKEVAMHGGDVSNFVPDFVAEKLKGKLGAE